MHRCAVWLTISITAKQPQRAKSSQAVQSKKGPGERSDHSCGLLLPPGLPDPHDDVRTMHRRLYTGGRALAQSSSDDLNASNSSVAAADLRPNQLSLREGLIWDPNALSAEEGASTATRPLRAWAGVALAPGMWLAFNIRPHSLHLNNNPRRAHLLQSTTTWSSRGASWNRPPTRGIGRCPAGAAQ